MQMQTDVDDGIESGKVNAFAAVLAGWPRERREQLASEMNRDRVLAALQKDEPGPADFLALLSPAADDLLENLARRAHDLTRRYFGRAVNIFTPLYISDVCTNHCRYCGFNANNRQKRRHLTVDEAAAEAGAIADLGFAHLLVLTGDAPRLSSPEYIASVVRKIRPRFASVGVEVYSMSIAEYQLLIAAGVDSMTMFQETYDPGLYAWLHPAGPKSDYAWRLAAPARAAAAGMRSLGIGALLGLDSFVNDAFATGLHADWLMRTFPGVEMSVSIPRICPAEGDFEVTKGVSDRELVRYVAALRCFLPRAGITCSSRESATMRNHLPDIGVTRVSAGVSTAVGGRATEDLHNPGQFEISDSRSLGQMVADLAARGYQAVIKDWEQPD